MRLRKREDPDLSLTLIKFAPAFGLPDPSPFGIKAELLLKMSGLPYSVEISGNPRKGPKGKLPALRDGDALIGDSEFIRKHLEFAYGIDFDQGLGPLQRARAHAFARMLEERTYWCGVQTRWLEDSAWPTVSRAFFGNLPPVVRDVVPALVQRIVRRRMRVQGIGRHTRDEIMALGIADFAAVSAELGDRAFFMGQAPTGIDATVYAMLAGIAIPPFENPIRTSVLATPNLVAYIERMRALYFP